MVEVNYKLFNVGMFKIEYELFWVILAMTSFMFRPDGYVV